MKQIFSTRYILITFIVATISYFLFTLWPDKSPQISIDRILLKDVIHVGEPAQIRVSVSRTKACPTTVHTWWVDHNGNVVANMITLSPFSNLVGVGSQVIDTSSDNLPPGRYKIMANGIIDCGQHGIFTAPNPDLDIEIVP